MTQAMQQFIKRLVRLPAAVQDRYIQRFSKELDEDLSAEEIPSEERERVPFERIKHLAGIIEGGPSDASTNKKYLEGLGESSMH